MMCPYAIEILLWYYSRCSDHPDIVRNPPVWRQTIEPFLERDLLTTDRYRAVSFRDVQIYHITERGQFYVTEGLCKVPLPVPRWEIPATGAKS